MSSTEDLRPDRTESRRLGPPRHGRRGGETRGRRQARPSPSTAASSNAPPRVWPAAGASKVHKVAVFDVVRRHRGLKPEGRLRPQRGRVEAGPSGGRRGGEDRRRYRRGGSTMPDLPRKKVGLISCSGEELPEGTVTRRAVRKVLETLRPDDTVTLCLPLFLAGGEGERAFARHYPTIAVDGCDKRCAALATEKYSAKPAASIVVTEIAKRMRLREDRHGPAAERGRAAAGRDGRREDRGRNGPAVEEKTCECRAGI